MSTLTPNSPAEYLLQSAFEELETYVAVDLARFQTVADPADAKYRPRWWNAFVMYWRPELGLKRLEEQMKLTLEDGSKAKTAQIAEEIKTLYEWYQRRKKRDTAIYGTEKDYPAMPANLVKTVERQIDSWIAEDQRMLRRLVDIRPNLWM